MTLAIPASAIVSVNPGVITAGGTALDLNGLMLTTNTRVPINVVQSFGSAAAVGAYFGLSSTEYARAQVYFAGFDNSAEKPAALLFAQYPQTAAVPAYLRGGNISGLSLAALQAITGVITITVDGVTTTSGSLNLSTATSFSSAATLIQTALAAKDAVCTGAIAVNSVTGSISGTTLTVSAVGSGVLGAGQTITGTNVTAGTTITGQLTGTAGGTGTYTVSISQTVASTTITASGGGLTVSAVASGTLAVGQSVTGTGVTAGTVITGLGTGTGGTGTYLVSISQTASSTTLTMGSVLVTYDSQAGAFVITSGMASSASSITFATGTASAALLLTAATGAVLSQGANIATPGAFMSNLVTFTQNWAAFLPIFTTSVAEKTAFAQWTNSTNDRFAYVMADTDVSPATTVPATASAGYAIIQANYSGTIPIWETAGGMKGSFILGVIASIDLNQTNGRITLAFKGQTGLTPDVTDLTTYNNLIANGYNCYASFSTAAQNFQFFTPGSITGPFVWADSYVNQIWLTNQLQLALMELLVTSNSIPYNAAGYSLIHAACNDPINQGLTNGVIRAGVTLSAAQVAEINAAAGANVAPTVQSRGWYLQVSDATPQVRIARGSPPITLWYTDGQSVQKINLQSLEVQ